MDRDTVIRLAREAGFGFPADHDLTEPTARLERFAALVAAAEREACARLVEDMTEDALTAAAIRARGETK